MDKSPESDSIWYALGEAYLRMGDYPNAEIALAKSLRIFPEHPTRLCYLGDALFHQQKYPQALEYYRKAVAAAPDFGEAYARLGAAYLKLGQFVQARECFVRHVEVEPNSYNALTNLASLLYNAGEYEEALRRIRQALEYAPKYAPAHQMLWRVLLSLHRRSEAIDALRTAHELRPDDREQAHILAFMLSTGKGTTPETVAEALHVLESCCPPDEAGPEHFDTLATALAASGDFPRAVEAAERALDLAQRQGNAAAVAQISMRLEAYRQGQMPRRNHP
jgi:tetratricopeptide (TPR) repeat protein